MSTPIKAILAAMAVAVLPAGCAKEVSTNNNELIKEYLEAWMSVNYPGVAPTGLGVYILDDQPGSGGALEDEDLFMFVDYTATDLNGNVAGTTIEKLSQQVGSFDASKYYGARVLVNYKGATEAGILEVAKGMRVGGTRKALVPGWLNVTKDYGSAEDYFKKASGTSYIYTITLVDKVVDITDWEIDTLSRYVAANMGVDSTKFGYYYKTLVEPTDTTTFSSDTSFYINYTGRLLNGHVFDTTIEDTAKVHGLWSSSKTYAPKYVKMASNHADITLGKDSSSSGTTTIEGFSFCLSRLRPYEKGVCAFYSNFGYGYTDKASAIPPYAPLVFEIEVVDTP